MSEMKPLEQHLTIIDEEGNEILVDNRYAFGDEAFIPLEPWVKEQDIKDFNYGA